MLLGWVQGSSFSVDGITASASASWVEHRKLAAVKGDALRTGGSSVSPKVQTQRDDDVIYGEKETVCRSRRVSVPRRRQPYTYDALAWGIEVGDLLNPLPPAGDSSHRDRGTAEKFQ